MKNNVLIVALVILIGLLSGIALLIGINTTVTVAMAPVNARLANVEIKQNEILKKLNTAGGGSSNNAEVLTQITALQNQLKAFEAKAMPQAPAGPPPEDLNKVHIIEIGNSPVMGKKDAPVTIVQFTDLQCPFCARFYPPLKEVVKAYPDQVNVVLKHYPLSFHPNARPAAKIALAANEQGKYFEMTEALLENGADVAEDKVKEYAKKTGVNYNKLMKDLKNNDAQYEKIINDDLALGDRVEVRGTPTFYINGKKTNARDFNGYKAEIDQILAAK
jgi:protein-disulfide isomerase